MLMVLSLVCPHCASTFSHCVSQHEKHAFSRNKLGAKQFCQCNIKKSVNHQQPFLWSFSHKFGICCCDILITFLFHRLRKTLSLIQITTYISISTTCPFQFVFVGGFKFCSHTPSEILLHCFLTLNVTRFNSPRWTHCNKIHQVLLNSTDGSIKW